MKKLITHTLFLLMTSTAHAKLNKCKSPEGKIVYSQFKCKENQTNATLQAKDETPLQFMRRKINYLIKETNVYEYEAGKKGYLTEDEVEVISKARKLIKLRNSQIDKLKNTPASEIKSMKELKRVKELLWRVKN